MGIEERVAEALGHGDQRAAAEVVIRGSGPEIFGYLTRLLHSPDAAAGALTTWAEEVWKEIGASPRRGSLRVWCYRIASGVAARLATEARRKGRRVEPTLTLASRIADEVRSASVPGLARESPQMGQLRQALSDEERQLLVLHVDRGFSWGEIAEVLAVEGQAADEAGVQRRFGRLKARLEILAKEKGLLK